MSGCGVECVLVPELFFVEGKKFVVENKKTNLASFFFLFVNKKPQKDESL
jgi:hypothetical protein